MVNAPAQGAGLPMSAPPSNFVDPLADVPMEQWSPASDVTEPQDVQYVPADVRQKRFDALPRPTDQGYYVDRCRNLTIDHVLLARNCCAYACPDCGYCSEDETRVWNHMRYFAFPGHCKEYMLAHHTDAQLWLEGDAAFPSNHS